MGESKGEKGRHRERDGRKSRQAKEMVKRSKMGRRRKEKMLERDGGEERQEEWKAREETPLSWHR